MSTTMQAMALEAAGSPLRLTELPIPAVARGLRLRVLACGVCRTDLHVVDGDLSDPKLPIIPGHEIVGRIAALGPGVSRFRPGDRVGIPWLGHTCGHCTYCRAAPKICDAPRFTGYQIDGGYAEYALAEAALLLCSAGRLRRCRGGTAPVRGIDRLPVAQAGGPGCLPGLIRIWRRGPYSGAGGAGSRGAGSMPSRGREMARPKALPGGLVVCGRAAPTTPPVDLDAAIIFAPVGALLPAALASCAKAGPSCSAVSI